MVSVIIPIYNGEKYIDKLFEQIEAQTYRDLEVLLINDGSTDGSLAAIENRISQAAGDSLSFRVITQDNTGQGGARNRGIEEATGDFLLFMDQDDRIKTDYIGRLLDVAIKDNSDIVISGYEHVTTDGVIKEHVELINNEWCRFMNITPWGKIYRRDFIKREKIRFLPVPLGEDIYFNVLCYSHTDKVAYTEYVGYQWIINNQSVSNTVHKTVSEESNILRLFEALAKMDSASKWMTDLQFEYFMLKTGLFHVLYAAKGTKAGDLIRYRNDVFRWLNDKMPQIENNKLITWNGPEGERTSVARPIFIYMMLRRIGLDGIFLTLWHLAP